MDLICDILVDNESDRFSRSLCESGVWWHNGCSNRRLSAALV